MQKLQNVVWGVIGAGKVCEKKSMPAMNKIPHSQVKTVMRRNKEACRDFAIRHHISNWTLDSNKIFNDPDINAVYISTPPDTHALYTIKAAQAGKAVYVEKPMARDHRECLSMISACEKANVPLFVAYYRRALPHFLRIKELLEQGKLGQVKSVQIHFNRSPQSDEIKYPEKIWRLQPKISGGGHFHDLASHQLDLMDFLFGPIIDVKGKAENIAGLYQVADTVKADFVFQNGIVGSGTWDFVSSEPDVKDEITIFGSEGELNFSTFAHARIEGVSVSMGQISEEMILPQHIQEPLIRSIVSELRGEGKCPSTGETAARTNQVMELICSKELQ
ncbi:MAG: Gfo/Idh/MocA family oxidoreductase [Candidatus Marinimicrobia bacterium]|nr:Gfo/Idh/MocA family oxidoreductase [Candidatus Neomarinimicrobiota bacterium]